MRIADPPLPAARMQSFTDAGYWDATTLADELDRAASATPTRIALVDGRERIDYATYRQRARRLAAHLVQLGLTADDVVAIQLPNWNEFPVAIAASVIAGVPFCQFHSDFRVRELEFMLRFIGASTLIVPARFRNFDYLEMVEGLRPRLPALKHVLVVGDDVAKPWFDLRGFLARTDDSPIALPAERRPHGNDFMRTAFTSGYYRRPQGRAAPAQHDQLRGALPQSWPACRTGQRVPGVPAGRAQLGTVQCAAGAVRRRHPGDAGHLPAGGGFGTDPAREGDAFLLCPRASRRAAERRVDRPGLARLVAEHHDRRRVLPDRGDPRGERPHPRPSARNVRHARMRHAGPHHTGRRPRGSVRHGRPAAPGNGHPGGGRRQPRLRRRSGRERFLPTAPASRSATTTTTMRTPAASPRTAGSAPATSGRSTPTAACGSSAARRR